jgi:hypothetical protein
VRLEIADNIRDLAIFNMAIDCKLRGCDLVRLKNAGRVCVGSMEERASVMQSKTQRLVQFEIMEQTSKPCSAGSKARQCLGATTFGQAGSMAARICRRGSTNVFCEVE